jgi:hypothetical protein
MLEQREENSKKLEEEERAEDTKHKEIKRYLFFE